MSKKTETKPLSPKTGAKPAKSGELLESDLDQISGGATKHPAKVTVPDLKLG